ncbi:Hypothetical protein SRAE_2000338000 [Strongyloides ratti]|uniref:Uncharacterized protein n=1 Tax=Strongyloides ratti TaxID=34506 RepID=A0A090LMH5_STRRB|nr:Hypothetical protein SRAE_2000338000 [Strongyloides ratti]CEF68725.1 Hypothetical protein SRAE_2000338000 [Strongyloides ratti]
MYCQKNFYYIILGFIFCCSIFAQYGPPTYGGSSYGLPNSRPSSYGSSGNAYSNYQGYSKPENVNVVRTQTLTTYNMPQSAYPPSNFGYSGYNKYSPYYSRYYPGQRFNSGPYSSYGHGHNSYLPSRGHHGADPADRAVMGLGLLASSLIGKKHA